MNEIDYKQARTCVRVGGTVAVIQRGNPNPVMITQATRPLPTPQIGLRYYAYGVKLDLKKEWASQWKTQAEFSILDDLL